MAGIKSKLSGLLRFEAILLASVLAGLIYLPAGKASYYQLYEIMGAVIAGMITTFGLLHMKDLT